MHYEGFENCQAANKSHSQTTILLHVICKAKKGSKVVSPFYHLTIGVSAHEIPLQTDRLQIYIAWWEVWVLDPTAMTSCAISLDE